MTSAMKNVVSVLIVIALSSGGVYLYSRYDEHMSTLSKASLNWPSIEGLITHANLEAHRSSVGSRRTTKYRVEIYYEYIVGDEMFENNVVRFDQNNLSTAQKERLVSGVPGRTPCRRFLQPGQAEAVGPGPRFVPIAELPVGEFGFVLVMIAIGGFFAWRQLVRRGRRMSMLISRGTVVTGKVTQTKQIRRSRTDKKYVVHYEFVTTGGMKYEKRMPVSPKEFKKFSAGQSIDIVYDPAAPEVNMLKQTVDEARLAMGKMPAQK